jgi:Domain of Unknown Function with PDB structure (DUF3857)
MCRALACLWMTIALVGCSSRPRPQLEAIGLDRADASDFPDANAVVLLDRYEVHFADSGDAAEVQWTRRIQVLTTAGIEAASLLVPFDERTQVVSLTGRLRSADGSERVSKDDAFIDVDRYKNDTPAAKLYDGPGYKFSRMTGVGVGDVVETNVLMRVRDARWLPPIVVGGALPLLRGEVLVDVPSSFDLDARVTRQGRIVKHPLNRIPTTVKMITEPERPATAGQRHAFVFDREPAVFAEGAAADAGALASQVHVLLRKGHDDFRTIDDVALWYRQLVGNSDQPGPDVKALVNGFKGGKTDKLRAVQRFLQDDVADAPTFLHLAALPVRRASDVLSKRVGDAKDQASLGLAMLRALGIDGFPVLVSRAGSFASIPDLPTPAPYNHVVIAIPAGGSFSFIDPSTPGLPTGRLPGSLQSSKGILVKSDGGELIDLPADDEDDNLVDVTLEIKLAADGAFSGLAKALVQGVDSAPVRRMLAVDDDQAGAKLQEVLFGARDGAPDFPTTITLTDVFRVASKDGNEDDSIRVQARMKQGIIAGNRIIMDDLAGRPAAFVWREGRKSPVFLGQKRTWRVRVAVKLPAGLGIAELPVSMEKPGSLVSIDERWAVADGTLFFQRNLVFHERIVPPERYDELRAALTASWARAAQAVAVVPGGDRGAIYNGDPF